MLEFVLRAFWGGIIGHNLVFGYGFALPFIWEWTVDLRTIFRIGIGLVVYGFLASIVCGLIFGLFFRPGAFSWLGLTYFNFGLFHYFAYFGIVFFIGDRFPEFLKQRCGNFEFFHFVLEAIQFSFESYSVRFIVVGIMLLSDYFVFSFFQFIAFALGASIGFLAVLLSVWCIMQRLRQITTLKTVPDFALKMGVLGVIGLIFSLS